MLSRLPRKALIFDLGDVLFTWSASTTTCIPARTLRTILSSDIWEEFDRGHISQDECYAQVADRFSLSTAEVREAFVQARNSVQPNHEIIAAIQQFRKSLIGTVKIIAMSNISREDYAALETRIADWNIFDQVFTSGHAGMRKPQAEFYRYVLQQTELHPQEVTFIDDKLENVIAARELGLHGVVFQDNQLVIDVIHNVERNPYERGWRYLLDHGKHCCSITDSGIVIDDNFARLLIQDIIPFDDPIEAHWDQKRTWNFFNETPVLVPGNTFPDDLDTTSLALMVAPPTEDILTSILDDMLQYAQEDGRFQTYFDWSKLRADEVVSANVLACFYRFGRGHQLTQTLDMIHNVLLDRTFAQGTRYYTQPDCCLFFFGRLLRSSNDGLLHSKLGPLLRTRMQERIGKSGSAVGLAMRIVTCYELGVDCSIDAGALLAWQQPDGGWPASWLYCYGSTGVQIGNRGVTTALAVKAIAYVQGIWHDSRDAVKT